MPGFRYLMLMSETALTAALVAIGFGATGVALFFSGIALLVMFAAHAVYTEDLDE